MSADYSKLLDAHIRLMVKVKQEDMPPVEAAQAAVELTADWFDDVLSVMGMMPSTIPSLLHWQAHAHEYIDFGGEDNDEAV